MGDVGGLGGMTIMEGISVWVGQGNCSLIYTLSWNLKIKLFSLWVNFLGKTMIIPCYSSLRLLFITENRYKINLYSFFLSWNNKQTQGKIIVFLFLWLNSLASSRPKKKSVERKQN
jgi:hypothetical protein